MPGSRTVERYERLSECCAEKIQKRPTSRTINNDQEWLLIIKYSIVRSELIVPRIFWLKLVSTPNTPFGCNSQSAMPWQKERYIKSEKSKNKRVQHFVRKELVAHACVMTLPLSWTNESATVNWLSILRNGLSTGSSHVASEAWFFLILSQKLILLLAPSHVFRIENNRAVKKSNLRSTVASKRQSRLVSLREYGGTSQDLN